MENEKEAFEERRSMSVDGEEEEKEEEKNRSREVTVRETIKTK